MKHIRFTVQFLILLLAIPLLMFVEITRDSKLTEENPGEKQESTHVEGTAYSATPPIRYCAGTRATSSIYNFQVERPIIPMAAT